MRGKGSEPTTSPTGPTGVRLTALSPAEVAGMISKGGGVRMTAADLKADVDAGAPVNEDGTISLITYAAWLVREVSDGD